MGTDETENKESSDDEDNDSDADPGIRAKIRRDSLEIGVNKQ